MAVHVVHTTLQYFWYVKKEEGPNLNVVFTNGNERMLLTPPLTCVQPVMLEDWQNLGMLVTSLFTVLL